MSDIQIPLPQGAGYGIIVGLGLAFSLGMILTTFVLRRYQKEIITAEEFSTAGRSVKTGLVATAVVSSWCWSATLLTSSSQVYTHGIFGGIAYSSGACFQIVLFAYLAIKLKQKAPECHTYLEVIKERYGTATHCVFIFFAIATNILVTAMLLAGGSAVTSDLTGMNTVAACFLLPMGVMLYTLFGGLKATFLTDYAHTIAIVVVIMALWFNTFGAGSKLGSPGVVWEKVMQAARDHPVEGNAGGSYLTMKSRGAGIFFVINIAGNFGTVFLDNGYWNKAIAANPASALPGYVLGGLAWFALPWVISTTTGLACIALESDPSFPTYPNRMSPAQVSAGLVVPNAAVTLMGKSGAAGVLIMIFMAVTSAMSAELIAFSSVITYDVFKSYVKPQASGKSLIMMSHASVVFFAIAMSGFATGLYYAQVSMGYLYELMGVIISSAVFPAAMTLLSKRQNKVAATVSPVLGTACAIASWLGVTKAQFGSVTYENSFMDDPMLVGNVVALLSPLIFVPVLTLIFKPDNYDWELLKNIKRVNEEDEIDEAENDSPAMMDPQGMHPLKSQVTSVAHAIADEKRNSVLAEEEAVLKRSSKIAGIVCVIVALSLIILWPMPMYGTGYIFSQRFFTGWVVVGIIWLFLSAFMVIIYPLYEGREGIYTSLRGIYWDCTGQTHKLREWQNDNPEKMHVVRSQISAEVHRQDNIDVVNETSSGKS